MPKKTYKYNCACDAKIHTNKPQVFRMHVARCPICQKKLPPEILESLEPQLSQLVQSFGEKAPKKVKPVKVEKEQKPGPTPAKIEKPLAKPVEIPPIPETDKQALDTTIKNLPSVLGLATTVANLKRDVGRVSSRMEDGFKGLTEEFKTLGEALQVMITKPSGEAGQEPLNTPPSDTREKVEMPPEAISEMRDIKGETGIPPTSTPEEEVPPEAVPGKEAAPEEPSRGGLPPLDSPEQVKTLEGFLAQEKQRLGMEGTGAEPARGKEGIPFIGEATEAIKQIRGVVDAVRGRGEGESLPRTTEELASKILINTIESVSKRKDPVEYLVEGMKAQGRSFSDAVTLIAKITGKGGGVSSDDIRKIVKEEVGKGGAETPKTEEHLT